MSDPSIITCSRRQNSRDDKRSRKTRASARVESVKTPASAGSAKEVKDITEHQKIVDTPARDLARAVPAELLKDRLAGLFQDVALEKVHEKEKADPQEVILAPKLLTYVRTPSLEYAGYSDGDTQLNSVNTLESSFWAGSQVNLIETSGYIKWFDIAKGYGFITSDDNLPDILLHVTTLRAAGHQHAAEGARVHCEALQRIKGIQVFRILDFDSSTAIHPSQLPQRNFPNPEPVSDWVPAVCKWFNRVRGFGFLSLGENREDIFVHLETLRRYGLTELRPGQRFEVRFGHGTKGCTATQIRVAGKKPPGPASH